MLIQQQVDKPKRKRGQPSLMQAIGFTEEDLAANQNGYLSQRQFVRFEREKRRSSRVFMLAFIGLPLLGGLLGLVAVSEYGTLSALGPLTIFLGSAVAVFILFIPGYRWEWKRQKRWHLTLENARRTGGVVPLEGRVNLDVNVQSGEGGTTYTYAVALGKMRFKVAKQVFLAFKNGDPYRIYYEPHTGRLLSAEWLREN